MIDLGALGESLRDGFGQIPPIAIALALLAGPTAALIGYRLVSAARRTPVATDIEPSPYWVCQDCRSINELRQARCYSCGLGRDATPEVEVIIEAPIARPTTFDVPAGSPFAALGGNADVGGASAPSTAVPGVPVMADASNWSTGVPVGPGRGEAAAVPVVAEDGEALMLADTPPAGAQGDVPLTPATKRHA
jgi:hypothetical protein